jgi:hypothetical protein
MADELDRTLTAGLTRLAERAIPDVGSLEDHPSPRPSKPAPTRLPSRALTAAAVALVLVAAGLVAVRVGDDSPDVVAGGGEAHAELVPPAPIDAVTGMSAAVIDDRVLIWGGRIEPAAEDRASTVGGDWSAEGAVYDLADGRWTEMAPSPLSARTQAGTVVLDGEMYVIGGLIPMSDDGLPRDGAAYDPATDRWRTIADLPEGVCVSQLIGVAAEQIIAVGRCQEGGEALPAASYDPATDAWTALPPAPLLESGPRSGHGGPSAIAVDSGLYFPNGAYSGALWSVAERRWMSVTGIPLPPPPAPSPLHTWSIASVGGDKVMAVVGTDIGVDGPTVAFAATLDIGAEWSEIIRLDDEQQVSRPAAVGGSTVLGRTMVWQASVGLAWMEVGARRPSATARFVDGVRVDRLGAALLPLDDRRLFVFGGQLPTGDVPSGRADPAIITFPG